MLAYPSNLWAQSVADKLVEYVKFTRESVETLDTEARSVLIEKEFDLKFSDEIRDRRLQKQSTENLGYLFRALNYELFYTPVEKYLERIESVAKILEKRHKLDEQQIKILHQVYVALRDFSKAERLKVKYPKIDFELIPKLQDLSGFSNSRHVWQVNESLNTLQKVDFDSSKYAHVVVVSHPNCHFSNNSIQDISADPQLKEVMKKNTTWLMPQDRRIDFELIKYWNATRKDFPMVLTNQKKEWPELQDWATPSFYFYKNNVLLYRFSGWPKAGNKDRLIEGLSLIGLWEHTNPAK